jgi:hypothetical protein
MVRFDGKVLSAFVSSSTTGKWRGVTFDGWWTGNGAVMLTSCRRHTHRSLYQTTSELFGDVLMLHTPRRMEFSVVRIPRVRRVRMHAIVERGEEGRLAFVC